MSNRLHTDTGDYLEVLDDDGQTIVSVNIPDHLIGAPADEYTPAVRPMLEERGWLVDEVDPDGYPTTVIPTA